MPSGVELEEKAKALFFVRTKGKKQHLLIPMNLDCTIGIVRDYHSSSDHTH